MGLKKILILAPIVLTLVLLQSYFWVPTYESQTKGNPERTQKFIEASIGDAKILNPILNADTSSSRIAGLIFEGLLDYDENLNLRGRLATVWDISPNCISCGKHRKGFSGPNACFCKSTRIQDSKSYPKKSVGGFKGFGNGN